MSKRAVPPTTPQRRRKNNVTEGNGDLKGIRPAKLTPTELGQKLKKLLSISYTPDEWQLTTITQILRGFDVIFAAGTSYGKSIIIEGVAAMNPKKICVVITPLKSLEADQAEGARRKGLKAVFINSDNSDNEKIWKDVRAGKYNVVYISPEMALSGRFQGLWSDKEFAALIAAVIVDEVHCVDEWGEGFRPQYQQLARLRVYTGLDVPVVACSATLSTSTFDVVWEKLGYGNRPFWGVDVGTDRSNLLFLIRPPRYPDNPALDVLQVIPEGLTDKSTIDDLKVKTLFYIQNEGACRDAVQTIRKCLPAQLRNAVYPFSSNLSEGAKDLAWKKFQNDEIKLFYTTDVTAMGLNEPKVDLVVVAGDPTSISAVAQRWGRAARDREHKGTCILLPPKWAFRPIEPQVNANAAAELAKRATGKGKGKSAKASDTKTEGKQAQAKRAKMQEGLVNLCNVTLESEPCCIHSYLKRHFRPDTRLDTYDSFDQAALPVSTGQRSRDMQFRSYWIVVNLDGRTPPADRCCHLCSPDLAKAWDAPKPDDPRLSKFASDFHFPLLVKPQREVDEGSQVGSEESSGGGRRNYYPAKCSPAHEEELVRRLKQWRQTYHDAHFGHYTSPEMVVLTDMQAEKIAKSGHAMLRADEINVAYLRRLVTWDLGDDEMLGDAAAVVNRWVVDVNKGSPQRSGGRKKKKLRVGGNTPRHVGPSRASPTSSANVSPFPTPSKPKRKSARQQLAIAARAADSENVPAARLLHPPPKRAPTQLQRPTPNVATRSSRLGRNDYSQPSGSQASVPPAATQPISPQQPDVFSSPTSTIRIDSQASSMPASTPWSGKQDSSQSQPTKVRRSATAASTPSFSTPNTAPLPPSSSVAPQHTTFSSTSGSHWASVAPFPAIAVGQAWSWGFDKARNQPAPESYAAYVAQYSQSTPSQQSFTESQPRATPHRREQ